MFEEILTSFRASLRERVTSPLLGTFGIAWVLWNYRLLAVLFSTSTYTEKFEYIDAVLYGGDFSKRVLCQFVGPAISTLIFVYAYPVLAKFVFKYWRTKQQETRQIRLEIDNKTLLTKEESFKLMQQLATLESEFEAQISERDNQISKLKEALRSKVSAETASVSENPPPWMAKPKSYSDAEKAVLRILGDLERKGQRISEVVFLQNSDDRLAMKAALDALIEANKVTNDFEADYNDDMLALTPAGRKDSLALHTSNNSDTSEDS